MQLELIQHYIVLHQSEYEINPGLVFHCYFFTIWKMPLPGQFFLLSLHFV